LPLAAGTADDWPGEYGWDAVADQVAEVLQL
jgi:hypothetical protein